MYMLFENKVLSSNSSCYTTTVKMKGGKLMRQWQKLRGWLWLISILPAAVIIFVSSHKWIALIMIISLYILAFVYYKHEKRHTKEQLHEHMNNIEQNQILMLSHQRHDAMNDVQVLLGYIRLDKKDKCIEYVEKIKERAEQESLIAKLKDYQLLSYIHQLKSSNYPIALELEFLNASVNWKKEFTRFMISVITCYQKYTVNHELSEPQLTVYLTVGDDIHILFEYNGQLSDENAWKAEIELEAAQLIHEKRLILTIDEQDINSTFLA